MQSILDKKFHYTPSFETDLKKTFSKVERERKKKEQAEQDAAHDRILKVVSR